MTKKKRESEEKRVGEWRIYIGGKRRGRKMYMQKARKLRTS